MSDSQEQSWFNHPYAPRVPYDLYVGEKATLAGSFIGSILYGALIVLFLQCMTALFNPVHRRREGIKWGPVSYTVIMFLSATVFTAVNLNIQSISFIDNREYRLVFTTAVDSNELPGPPSMLLGPLGYQWSILTDALSVTLHLMFLLNYWLANGLLLYRCYVVYAMRPWVIAFPCLMYLASFAMGALTLVSQIRGSTLTSINFYFGRPYLAISVLLNVLLTLMIVVRLVLHSKNIRAAMGNQGGIGGFYKTAVTILIESSALYATSSLLVVGLSKPVRSAWVLADMRGITDAFDPILAETQVIAPLLIIKQIANQSALTSDAIVTGHAGSLNFGTPGNSMGVRGGAFPDWYSMSSANRHEKDTGDLGVET